MMMKNEKVSSVGVGEQKVHNNGTRLFDFASTTLTVVDLAYFLTIFLTSINPWLSLGLAILFPLLNVPAVKYEGKTGKALIAYTLPLTLIPMFFITYVSGPSCPAWLMVFSGVAATHIIYPIAKMKLPLSISFILVALLGSWLAGVGYFQLSIVTVIIISYTSVLVRLFMFIEGEKQSLQIEVWERKAAQKSLRDAFDVIQGSVTYASRIQRSVLPSSELANHLLPQHFVCWRPRDVVGGDLYWIRKWGEGSYIILGDCTGHGVPGAFMTLIANSAFERSIDLVETGNCAELIAYMHRTMQLSLGQESEGGDSDDGIELGVVYLPDEGASFTYAGARFSLFYHDVEGDVIELKGDKKGICYRTVPHDATFTNKTVERLPGRRFIMTTDGMIDQVGSDTGRMMGKKRFKSTILKARQLPIAEVGDFLYSELETFQGKQRRRDDVAVLGFE